MKEITTTVDDWDWCIDDVSRLEPWFSVYKDLEEKFLVSRHGSVALFKVSDVAGKSYFVRHETPDGLTENLKAWFRSKARSLYEASLLLEQHGIPAVKCAGWAKCGTESMLLSEEYPDSMSALEYWYRIVPDNNVLRLEFLSKLSELLGRYYKAGIVQDDLSLEHILVKEDGSEMAVLQAGKVEECAGGLDRDEKISIIRPFAEMRGELTADNATIWILNSGIAADSQEAGELWDEAVAAYEQYIEEDLWPGIEEAIQCCEENPYCRFIFREDGFTCVRNTLWHAPVELSSDGNSHAEEVPREEAGKIFLNSIKARILREPVQKLPVVWVHYEGEKNDIIRYADSSEADYSGNFMEP